MLNTVTTIHCGLLIFSLHVASVKYHVINQVAATEGRVDPGQLHKSSFLFPETTKNFADLPLEFQVLSYVVVGVCVDLLFISVSTINH